MKQLLTATLLLAFISIAAADLSMPKKRYFYDQLGEGLANIVMAPAELFDSPYGLTMAEGGTIGNTKGFVQGMSRMVMDVCVGIAEVVTCPFAMVIDDNLKSPAYDSGQVEVYPPADLKNWY